MSINRSRATQSSSSSLSSSPASCVCKRTGHRLSTIVVEGEATGRLYHLRKKDLHMKTSHVDNMCHSTHTCEIMSFHKIEQWHCVLNNTLTMQVQMSGTFRKWNIGEGERAHTKHLILINKIERSVKWNAGQLKCRWAIDEVELGTCRGMPNVSNVKFLNIIWKHLASSNQIENKSSTLEANEIQSI